MALVKKLLNCRENKRRAGKLSNFSMNPWPAGDLPEEEKTTNCGKRFTSQIKSRWIILIHLHDDFNRFLYIESGFYPQLSGHSKKLYENIL